MWPPYSISEAVVSRAVSTVGYRLLTSRVTVKSFPSGVSSTFTAVRLAFKVAPSASAKRLK